MLILLINTNYYKIIFSDTKNNLDEIKKEYMIFNLLF
jgi:hypothetical protein